MTGFRDQLATIYKACDGPNLRYIKQMNSCPIGTVNGPNLRYIKQLEQLSNSNRQWVAAVFFLNFILIHIQKLDLDVSYVFPS